MTKWNILFWIASGIYIFGALIFAIFISAKPQAWGRTSSETHIQTIDESMESPEQYVDGSVCNNGFVNENANNDNKDN
jgi:hypothetical protein